MAKLKFALYWAATCGGCEIAVLDVNEKILDIVNIADIVFWPVALDFKYKDVEAMEDKSVDVCLFNGGIRNSEAEHIAKLLREKSKVMVAFGACSCFGGIPGLANISNRDGVFERVYKTTPTTDNPEGTLPQTSLQVPEGELTLPEFYNSVRPLNYVVEVEYYIPGCPPPPDLVLTAVQAIAENKLPPPGSTIAPEKNLCEECEKEKSDEKKVKEFKRPWQIIPDPTKCLLEQGLICCGPATRAGCGARCLKVNMPCRGCFGPTSEVEDQGAKLLSSISSIIDSDDEDEINRIITQIKDPLGTFYRFTLPSSVLRRVKVS